MSNGFSFNKEISLGNIIALVGVVMAITVGALELKSDIALFKESLRNHEHNVGMHEGARLRFIEIREDNLRIQQRLLDLEIKLSEMAVRISE